MLETISKMSAKNIFENIFTKTQEKGNGKKVMNARNFSKQFRKYLQETQESGYSKKKGYECSKIFSKKHRNKISKAPELTVTAESERKKEKRLKI